MTWWMWLALGAAIGWFSHHTLVTIGLRQWMREGRLTLHVHPPLGWQGRIRIRPYDPAMQSEYSLRTKDICALHLRDRN